MPTPVVLLHGFAGTARHWDRVLAALPADRYAPLPLELAEAVPVTADAAVALIADRAPERFVLAGYSMGARVALHAALSIPQRIAGLVLISASAGIEDESDRFARRAADEALAVAIERDGIEAFIERWRAVPLFAGDPDEIHDEIARDERRCTPAALAASLRGLGPGQMASMWGRLGELEMPVEMVAGALDARYVAAGRRLAAAISGARLQIVPGAGHRVALQAPEAVVAALAAIPRAQGPAAPRSARH